MSESAEPDPDSVGSPKDPARRDQPPTPDQVGPDQVESDQARADSVASDQAPGDSAGSDQAPGDSVESDQSPGDSGGPGHADASATGADQARPDEALVRSSSRAAQTGTVMAAIAVLAAIIAPVFSLAGFDLWAALAALGCVVMLAICVVQMRLWRRVAGGEQITPKWTTISWAAHLLSYLVAVLGLLALLVTMSFDGPYSLAFWGALLAALAMLLAQSTGAVQFLRTSGPPGTLPAHIRRLVEATTRLGS